MSRELAAARKAAVEVFIDAHYDDYCDGALEFDWLASHTESARTLIESLVTVNPQILNGLALLADTPSVEPLEAAWREATAAMGDGRGMWWSWYHDSETTFVYQVSAQVPNSPLGSGPTPEAALRALAAALPPTQASDSPEKP